MQCKFIVATLALGISACASGSVIELKGSPKAKRALSKTNETEWAGD